jgi:tetratricopeptide (TPR) repeat protein
LKSLGSAATEEPFWRRFDKSFKYPLNTYALVMIIGVAILSSILAYVPFAFLWQLMLTGAMVSYCFACLKQTAIGNFTAPDITMAYQGGLELLARLLAIFVVTIVIVGLIFTYLSPLLGVLAGVIAIVFMPATIILFGFSNSLTEALNPLKQFRLITAVGLPYGLILVFIFIMSASVGIINEIIGFQFSIVSITLQAAVSNYYSVVMFHIMGYMIFQYQEELGFTARADHGEGHKFREESEKTKHLVDILVKEGEFSLAIKELKQAIKKFPDDPHFVKQYFEFIHASKNTNAIAEFGNYYLAYLIRHHANHSLNPIYKRILQIQPDFQPDKAEIRYHLAQELYQAGDCRTAVKVLNHLHKEFPHYVNLPAAYELMAECLAELPGMQKHELKYRRFAAKLNNQSDATQSESPEERKQPKPPKQIYNGVDQDIVDSMSLVPQED